MKTLHNGVLRNMTPNEMAEMQATQTDMNAALQTEAAAAAAKAAALANARTKLAALGLSDDEIAALLG
jgi:hypothetical protein